MNFPYQEVASLVRVDNFDSIFKSLIKEKQLVMVMQLMVLNNATPKQHQPTSSIDQLTKDLFSGSVSELSDA